VLDFAGHQPSGCNQQTSARIPADGDQFRRDLRTRGLRVTLKPRGPVLPRLGESKSVPIRHLDFRKTLRVHHRVFPDDIVLIQQEGRESVNLIGGKRPLFA